MLRRLGALVLIAIVITGILSFGGTRVSARAEPQSNVPDALLKKQAEAARKVYAEKMKLVKAGTAQIDERLFFWSERLLEAELAVHDKPADRNALYKVHLKRVKELESLVTARADQLSEADVQAAKYFVIEAEINMLDAKE